MDKHACIRHPGLKSAKIYSDKGSQYTSEAYKEIIRRNKTIQSMNSEGDRCHNNAQM